MTFLAAIGNGRYVRGADSHWPAHGHDLEQPTTRAACAASCFIGCDYKFAGFDGTNTILCGEDDCAVVSALSDGLFTVHWSRR